MDIYLGPIWISCFHSLSLKIITHHSNMVGPTPEKLVWICFQFQFPSPKSHQNEWWVSENENTFLVYLSYDDTIVISLIKWDPLLSVLSNQTKSLSSFLSFLSFFFVSFFLLVPNFFSSLFFLSFFFTPIPLLVYSFFSHWFFS